MQWTHAEIRSVNTNSSFHRLYSSASDFENVIVYMRNVWRTNDWTFKKNYTYMSIGSKIQVETMESYIAIESEV